jgi:hypothetical protein
MEAGGIIDEGAGLIRIIHSDQSVTISEESEVKTVAQSFKSLTDSNKMLPAKTDDNQITTNENDIPPFFQQAISSSAIGALATKQGKKRLLTEQENIADNSQRPLLVYRRAWKEPLASNTNDDIELFSPAKPARYDYTKSNLINALKISATNKSPRIQRITETNKPRKSESLILPIKGLNIPFADVALQDGDSVIVERLQPPLFTVIGLVNSPGNFPYPPDVQYTLMQAIGFGEGLNLIAEPRYATIYRLKRNGTCIHATFPIRGNSKLADASNTLIKPGDIVAVEHTPRTRTAIFLDRTFRSNIGTYWSLNDNRY